MENPKVDIDTGSLEPALAQGGPVDIDTGAPNPIAKIKDDSEYEALGPGRKFIAPDGSTRTKPFAVTSDEEYGQVPEGAQFVDPEGNLRTKPKYEPLSITSQTLYDMAINDKERRKALERSYPGKVKQTPSGEIYVDDDGVLRKSKGFSEGGAIGTIASSAAPVVGSVAGEIYGGAVGSRIAPVAGTLGGAVIGGGVGGAAGQGFNDLVLQLAGVYDRSAGEEAGNLAIAGAVGAGGSAAGRAISYIAPAAKDFIKNTGPKVAAKFFGADKEGVETALQLAEKGVKNIPPSGWAKESPHLINVAEVFDPAFRTQKPMLQSATQHFEKQGAEILEGVGVKDAGSLVKPEAAPSTQAAGEALLQRRLAASEAADAKLTAALAARSEQAAADEIGRTTQRRAVETAATGSRQEADRLIATGFQGIQSDIDAAMRTARAGHNSGDLWAAVGDRLRQLRAGVGNRARTYYQQADAAAEGQLPNAEGLPERARQFLQQLPENFQSRYPTIVQRLEAWAGREAEMGPEGQVIRGAVEPTQPTFGQLHNIRSDFRHNVNWYDLTPDIKDGTYKFFANRVDEVLHDPNAVPQLQLASRLLDATDRWYAEAIAPFKDKAIQAVVSGLESGMPADPKNLFSTVVKEGRSDLINQVRGMVGPNLWAGVRAADVQEMLDMSRTLVPDVIDGRAFSRQVLDRHRHGMLDAVHGRDVSQQLIRQAQMIEALEGRLDIPVRPGDTMMDVVQRARTAAEAAKQEAKTDPLKALQRDMQKIESEHKRGLAQERRNDPLGFINNPTVGATQAVEKILGSEDLILAAAGRFGSESPEFNALRQVYAQRFLQSSTTPSEALKGVSAEVQAIMFPGATLDQMKVLAKEMDFLMGSRGAQEGTGKSIAATARVEHPWGSIPLGKGIGKILPGADYAGRQMLSSYYAAVTNLLSKPGLLRYVERGLKGDPVARERAKAATQKAMRKGGALGAGLSQSQYQAGAGTPAELETVE